MHSFLRLFLLIFCFIKLTACSDATTEQSLTLVGSSTIGEHLMPELVRAFFENQDIKTTFSEQNRVKGIRNDTFFVIDILPQGSIQGISALAENKPNQIAMVSESKLLTDTKATSLRLATDSLVVVVHRHNPIQTLSLTDVQAIFSGTIQKWEQLIPSYRGSIHVHVRDSSSGTSSVFHDLVLPQHPLSMSAKKHSKNADLVADMRRDFGGIGYLSASEWAENEDFKIISIQNTTLKRDLYLLFYPEQQTAFSQSFLQFCRSPQAREIIEGLKFGF